MGMNDDEVAVERAAKILKISILFGFQDQKYALPFA